MRRTSPKFLVLIAAALTAALLAFVFLGRSSPDRTPKDRLTDQQALAPSASARQRVDISAIELGSEETAEGAPPPPPPASPEAQAEPGPVAQPETVVRPATPAPPSRSAKQEVRQAPPPPAPAKRRPEPVRTAEVRKAKPKAAPAERRRPESPAKTASAPSPARVAAVRPSFSCRYARTRSEVAVCGDAGLAGLDQQMASQFNTAYRQSTRAQREVLERSRMRFLYRRDRCQSASCIAEVYRRRMSEIDDIAARNWREQ